MFSRGTHSWYMRPSRKRCVLPRDAVRAYASFEETSEVECILDSASCPGSWILEPWIVDAGSWILDPGSRMSNPGSRMSDLDPGGLRASVGPLAVFCIWSGCCVTPKLHYQSPPGEGKAVLGFASPAVGVGCPVFWVPLVLVDFMLNCSFFFGSNSS